MTERRSKAEQAHTHKAPVREPAPERHGASETEALQETNLAAESGPARLATTRTDGRGNSGVRAADALQLQRQMGNRVARRMLQRQPAHAAGAPQTGAASTQATALPPGLLAGGGLPGALLTDPRLAGREAVAVGSGAARQLQRMIGADAAGAVLQGIAGTGDLAVQRKLGDLPTYSGATGKPDSILRRLVDQVNAYNDLDVKDTNYDRQLTILNAIDALIRQYASERGRDAKDYIADLEGALSPELLHVQNRQISQPKAPVRRGPPPLPASVSPPPPSSVSSSSASSPPRSPASRLPPPLPTVVPTGDGAVSATPRLPLPPPGRAGHTGGGGGGGGGSIPSSPPRAPLRPPVSSPRPESKHPAVVTGTPSSSGDVDRPQSYETKGPVRMAGLDSVSGGSGTNIQRAFGRIAGLLQSGGYAESIGVEQQIAVSTLISKLMPDVEKWEDTPPSASDQIALLKLIAAVEGGSSSGVNSALAGLGIDMAEVESEEAPVSGASSSSGATPSGDPYIHKQDAALVLLNQQVQDDVKQHGPEGAMARADREVKVEKVEAASKTAVKTAVGVGLGFVPVPGVAQVYSLALAVNQVRSTLGHIRNLKKIRKGMLAGGLKESDAQVADLDYIIGKKNQRAIRSGVGGVPIVGTAKTAVLKAKGLYKIFDGKRGVHRQEIAERLRAAAKQGNVNAQRIILELVGADQYKAALAGRAGADLIKAKMAST